MKQSSRSIAAAYMALTAVGVAVASTSARADSADVFASAKDAGALAVSAKDGGAVQAVGFAANAKDCGLSPILGAKDGGFSAVMSGKDASMAQ
jgi:hypothetical protein